MNRQHRNDVQQIIQRIEKLARNLWWSWNPRAQLIFQELSPLIWETSKHNPVAVLLQFSRSELQARLGNEDFRNRTLPVLDAFESYMRHKPSPSFRGPAGKKGGGSVAYFCAEFGIHECLPFYSGGLGVLAGDHVKAASDLGLDLVGVGLFYRQGYFQQLIDAAGNQQESYPTTNPAQIPVSLVTKADGTPLLCSVTIGASVVHFQAWQINVGRATVYLLDTDVQENADDFRGLTALAYGGDTTTRIRQEIVLGIGGVRLLRTIGMHPDVFHMNEGHSAFLTIELLREQIGHGVPRAKAESLVRKKCIFTTHTPVAAGHDRFPADLIEFTLRPLADAMKISTEELMMYGGAAPSGHFTMTVLALKLSRAANAVSAKHAEISRLMWHELYPSLSVRNVPIGSVTNGIHIPSWTTPAAWEFWERHNSHKWKEHLVDARFWKHVTDPAIVSDEELWALRSELRRDLVEFIRRQAAAAQVLGGLVGAEALYHLLSFDALTIGFARRFAPYKRAHLIFSNMQRLVELLSDQGRPLQLVFAGKAHPRDGEGKELLHAIIEFTRHPAYSGKVVFLENYDMSIARRLVSGCDVWLNTPRRPLEASGTSGQKVAISGGLNASILDGWWLEGYAKNNGWAIGGRIEEDLSPGEVDQADANALYDLLANDILPTFYTRDSRGIPRKWIARIRQAMRTLIPVYNTHRMVTEYATKYYFPD